MPTGYSRSPLWMLRNSKEFFPVHRAQLFAINRIASGDGSRLREV
jgi:hypothetical protein